MFGNNMTNPFMSYTPITQNIPMTNFSNIPIMSMRATPMPQMMNSIPQNRGLLSSLFGLGRGANTGSIMQGIRSGGFGNLLNNASKALGVVKEAIPIVKEVGPMFGNMKSMLKLASVFKDETDSPNKANIQKNNTNTKTQDIKEKDTSIPSTTINTIDNNQPNFFL